MEGLSTPEFKTSQTNSLSLHLAPSSPLLPPPPPFILSPSFYLSSSLGCFILPSYAVVHFSPSVSVCCTQTFSPPLQRYINSNNTVTDTTSKQFN